MNQNDESARFTIDEEREVAEAAPDTLYLAEAESLRIEKLSTRVTLVAVLIPCLLVVILGVAYLDIKKRVLSTQTSGSMGVQNLSKDLDSRFSNLSLKQAKIEAQLEDQATAIETVVAATKVDLKKHTDDLERRLAQKPDQKMLDDLDAAVKKTGASIAGMQQTIADLESTFDRFDDELAGQIKLIADGLKRDQGRMEAIEKTASRLDAEKMSKESLDLAMGLERLALQEMVKDKIRELDRKIAGLDKTIQGMDQRLDEMSGKISRNALPVSPAPVVTTPPPPARNPTGSGTAITEQPLD